MTVFSVLHTLWIVIQVLFGMAVFWGIGLLGCIPASLGMSYVHELSGSDRPRSLPRLPTVWVSLAAAAVVAGLAFLATFASGVSPGELVDLVLPRGDVEALLEVPDSTVLLEAIKKDPNGFLLTQFTSGEAFCTSVGAALILLVWGLLCHLLCDREDAALFETWQTAATGAANWIISVGAAVIAFTCWHEIRSALIWVLSWGTGRFFPDAVSNVFLSILHMVWVIAVGGLMIGVVLKEIMENSVLCVMLGCAVSRLFITPLFSDASRIGYIVLAGLISMGFHFLYGWGHDRFPGDEDYTPLTYCYNGVFFLVSASATGLISFLYIRLFAA